MGRVIPIILNATRVRVKLPAMEPRRARVVWVAHLDCRGKGPIHSTDRVRVERGGAPQRWCGFHASMI